MRKLRNRGLKRTGDPPWVPGSGEGDLRSGKDRWGIVPPKSFANIGHTPRAVKIAWIRGKTVVWAERLC